MVSRQARWAKRHRAAINLRRRIRRCERYLTEYGNMPDAKRAALSNRFYVQASVWETALGKLIEKRTKMNTETETQNATAEQAQENAGSAAQEGAAGTGNDAQAETGGTEKEEPARTGAAAEADRAAVAFFVTYVAGDDDVSHGVNAAGIDLAAIIVKVNEDKTVNLHAFAAESAATLFKANVEFGTLPGQCHF